MNLPSREPSVRPVGDSSGAALAAARFAAGCLALDLEVGSKDKRIHAFAAVRWDGLSFTYPDGNLYPGGNLASALAKLDVFAEGATYVLGHNLIQPD